MRKIIRITALTLVVIVGAAAFGALFYRVVEWVLPFGTPPVVETQSTIQEPTRPPTRLSALRASSADETLPTQEFYVDEQEPTRLSALRAFSVNETPPTQEFYAEEEVPSVPPVNEVSDTSTEALFVNASDAELLARLLYAECRGESRRGQLMVAQCVLDRLADGSWGSDMKSVIYAYGAFADPGKLTDGLLAVAQSALNGERYDDRHAIIYFRRTRSVKDWFAPYLGHIGQHAFYGYPIHTN